MSSKSNGSETRDIKHEMLVSTPLYSNDHVRKDEISETVSKDDEEVVFCVCNKNSNSFKSLSDKGVNHSLDKIAKENNRKHINGKSRRFQKSKHILKNGFNKPNGKKVSNRIESESTSKSTKSKEKVKSLRKSQRLLKRSKVPSWKDFSASQSEGETDTTSDGSADEDYNGVISETEKSGKLNGSTRKSGNKKGVDMEKRASKNGKNDGPDKHNNKKSEKKKTSFVRWSFEEEICLRDCAMQMYKKNDTVSWKTVSEMMPKKYRSRTTKKLRNKWRKLLFQKEFVSDKDFERIYRGKSENKRRRGKTDANRNSGKTASKAMKGSQNGFIKNGGKNEGSAKREIPSAQKKISFKTKDKQLRNFSFADELLIEKWIKMVEKTVTKNKLNNCGSLDNFFRRKDSEELRGPLKKDPDFGIEKTKSPNERSESLILKQQKIGNENENDKQTSLYHKVDIQTSLNPLFKADIKAEDNPTTAPLISLKTPPIHCQNYLQFPDHKQSSEVLRSKTRPPLYLLPHNFQPNKAPPNNVSCYFYNCLSKLPLNNVPYYKPHFMPSSESRPSSFKSEGGFGTARKNEREEQNNYAMPNYCQMFCPFRHGDLPSKKPPRLDFNSYKAYDQMSEYQLETLFYTFKRNLEYKRMKLNECRETLNNQREEVRVKNKEIESLKKEIEELSSVLMKKNQSYDISIGRLQAIQIELRNLTKVKTVKTVKTKTAQNFC